MDGIALPFEEVSRERTLSDGELASVIRASREIGGPFGAIVEMLALTGQRREEVARMTWPELDLNARTWTLEGARTKNGRAHIVHLAQPALQVLDRCPSLGLFVFTTAGAKPLQAFSLHKRRLDTQSGLADWRLHDLRRTVVSGMARLGVAPHIADRILNHVGGTIGGVAAVYQRHEFLAERKAALDLWGAHVADLLSEEC
jgi:integrase